MDNPCCDLSMEELKNSLLESWKNILNQKNNISTTSNSLIKMWYPTTRSEGFISLLSEMHTDAGREFSSSNYGCVDLVD